MQAGIERFLRENGTTFSITKDVEFAGSKNVIDGRAKYLRELGMGKKPTSWTVSRGALGSHSLEALVNTMAQCTCF